MRTGTLHIAFWTLLAEWRAHPGRLLVGLLAIALGVALGVAVHHINRSALAEFGAALRSINGEADLIVKAPRGGMPEAVLDLMAADPGIERLSPRVQLTLADRDITLIGLDVFEAGSLSPDLIGTLAPEHDHERFARLLPGVFISAALRDEVRDGQLELPTATGMKRYPVRGQLDAVQAGLRLAVMDIAVLQTDWALSGVLHQIDVRLAPGQPADAVRTRLAKQLPAGVQVLSSELLGERQSNLSRAYRVNLNVLALVALFTGAFLVFANQSLSVVRRRSQFALLRVLGLRARALGLWITLEGALLGLLGGLLGTALGLSLAAGLLRWLGTDLGGGYFSGQPAELVLDWPALVVFVVLALLAGALASLLPAREAAMAPAAAALRPGAAERVLTPAGLPWPALMLAILCAALLLLPPIDGLALGAYLAIAGLLLATIAAMPWLTAVCFGPMARHWPGTRGLGLLDGMARCRLGTAPGQAGVASAAIVASLSLVVAMTIMIGSFRVSVADWLDRVLPADLYLSSALGRDDFITPAELEALAALRVDDQAASLSLSRLDEVALHPERAPVALIARPIDARVPGAVLPMSGEVLHPRGQGIAVWVSEPMLSLHGWQLGTRQQLPLAGQWVDVEVLGIWRDYARATGAIVMAHADYVRLTGDDRISDAALALPTGASLDAWRAAVLAALPDPARRKLGSAREIRELSLEIFDRSFAVTYLLQAAALLVGLFGIATTLSTQILARGRELGMLRHLGFTPAQLRRLLAIEGSWVTGLGVLVGCLLGLAISLILIHRVNPQSFHWTMDLRLPWQMLTVLVLVVLAAGTLTAWQSARAAMATQLLRLVREES
jgi:putative ABC transport system permease protein